MKKQNIILTQVAFFLFFIPILSSLVYARQIIRPMPPEARSAYEALSPFEFKNVLIDTAQKSCDMQIRAGKACRVLNAGRGNPNFLNTTVREAFSKLHTFSSELAGKLGPTKNLGLRPSKNRISEQLDEYIETRCTEKEKIFLKNAVTFAEKELGLNPDDLVFELVDAALGDFYPSPPRILTNIENIISAYLNHIHFRPGHIPEGKFDLFATEGATAAMIYIFQSLKENKILAQGDHIAIITPIFSPYLEIPLLNDFNLKPIHIESDEDKGWEVSDKEIAKLEDKRIKALFMVNPMNPGSVSMSSNAVKNIARIIKTKRRDLIVLTDTVYAPFVNEFHDLLEEIPGNTIGVYSYSKYFGVTGWRLGVIMLHENNVIDRMIGNLPEKDKTDLNMRYGIDSTTPDKIKFIDRIVMDSRDVALAHTGGLSTPQQCIMALFSLYELLDKEKAYKKSIQAILTARIRNLYDQLNLKAPEGPDKTHYYALIDIAEMANTRYGSQFTDYLRKTYSPLDFLLRLAAEKYTVLLPGYGFAGPKWSIRVSLANLNDEDYITIGKNISDVMNEFHSSWSAEKNI